MEDPSPESFRQLFQLFYYQDVASSWEALSRHQELGCHWLQPELCTKEQILEPMVLLGRPGCGSSSQSAVRRLWSSWKGFSGSPENRGWGGRHTHPEETGSASSGPCC